MERVKVNGVELEYEVRGTGEPIVLLHGGLLCDENTPLAKEPALTDHFTVLNYHRRGFAGSDHPDEAATLEDQADDCVALMDFLGFKRAHIVGHSLGGAIAMQLALQAPDRVNDLVLMEPALMAAFAKLELEKQSPAEAAESQRIFLEGMQKVDDIYQTGDAQGALVAFLETRAGDAFRGVLDFLTATGEFQQAIADAGTFLTVEMPAAYAWDFTPAAAKRISCPVLSILGQHSPVRAQRVHEILTEWVPQTEPLVLPWP